MKIQSTVFPLKASTCFDNSQPGSQRLLFVTIVIPCSLKPPVSELPPLLQQCDDWLCLSKPGSRPLPTLCSEPFRHVVSPQGRCPLTLSPTTLHLASSFPAHSQLTHTRSQRHWRSCYSGSVPASASLGSLLQPLPGTPFPSETVNSVSKMILGFHRVWNGSVSKMICGSIEFRILTHSTLITLNRCPVSGVLLGSRAAFQEPEALEVLSVFMGQDSVSQGGDCLLVPFITMAILSQESCRASQGQRWSMDLGVQSPVSWQGERAVVYKAVDKVFRDCG